MKLKKRMVLLLTMLIASVAILTQGCRAPEIEGAVVHFNKKMYKEALNDSEAAVKAYPNNPEAWFWLGKTHAELGHIEEMVKAFDKSLEIAPTFKDQIKQIRYKYFTDNFNEAVKNLQAVNKIDDPEKITKFRETASKKLILAKYCRPDFYMTYVQLVATEAALGHPDRAEAFADEAINAFPKNDTLLYHMGNYFFGIGNIDRALELYENAHNLNPDNTDVILGLADAYMKKKEYSKAKDYLNAVLDKNPDNAALLFNVAALYYNLKEYKESVQYFERLLQIKNDSKQYWELYAQALYNAELFEKAATDLSQAVEIIPDSPMLWEYLAFSYTRIGKVNEAKEAQKRAKELQNQ